MGRLSFIVLSLLPAVVCADEISLNASPSMLVVSVNNPGLNPALTGQPRQLRIENTSEVLARNVRFTWLNKPNGAHLSPASCGHIAPKASCVLTVTPGLWPSSDETKIQLKGDNTAVLSVPIKILTYGSVHEGGYVFSIDDSGSKLKGKVLSLKDQISPTPGIVWSSNGRGGRFEDAVFDAIPQVYDNSLLDCDAKVDGACNTAKIVNYYSRPMQHAPIPLKSYAAGICQQYATDKFGKESCTGSQCLSDWYLPAICEFDRVSADIPESIVCPNSVQNVVANLNALIDINCSGPQCLTGSYWSSTAHYNRSYPQYSAWNEDFDVSGSSQYNDDKNNQYGVRCVRAFE